MLWEILSFLHLINISVTVGLSFLLQSIQAIISSNTINIWHFLFGLYPSISSILFEYSIKASESFKWIKPKLSCLLTNNWHFTSYGSLAYKQIL